MVNQMSESRPKFRVRRLTDSGQYWPRGTGIPGAERAATAMPSYSGGIRGKTGVVVRRSAAGSLRASIEIAQTGKTYFPRFVKFLALLFGIGGFAAGYRYAAQHQDVAIEKIKKVKIENMIGMRENHKASSTRKN